MRYLLHKLAYFDKPTYVTVAGEQVVIRPDQIVVWVSLAERKQAYADPQAFRLPVILDTGLSHNLAIREEHLLRWAGLHPSLLPECGRAGLNEVAVRLLDADVWIYRNRPNERDRLLEVPPFRLELEGGISVYPLGTPTAPRLPVLGLRGLRWAKLYLAIDACKLRVSLRTLWRFWFFG
jgi:hypothetical protein